MSKNRASDGNLPHVYWITAIPLRWGESEIVDAIQQDGKVKVDKVGPIRLESKSRRNTFRNLCVGFKDVSNEKEFLRSMKKKPMIPIKENVFVKVRNADLYCEFNHMMALKEKINSKRLMEKAGGASVEQQGVNNQLLQPPVEVKKPSEVSQMELVSCGQEVVSIRLPAEVAESQQGESTENGLHDLRQLMDSVDPPKIAMEKGESFINAGDIKKQPMEAMEPSKVEPTAGESHQETEKLETIGRLGMKAAEPLTNGESIKQDVSLQKLPENVVDLPAAANKGGESLQRESHHERKPLEAVKVPEAVMMMGESREQEHPFPCPPMEVVNPPKELDVIQNKYNSSEQFAVVVELPKVASKDEETIQKEVMGPPNELNVGQQIELSEMAMKDGESLVKETNAQQQHALVAMSTQPPSESSTLFNPMAGVFVPRFYVRRALLISGLDPHLSVNAVVKVFEQNFGKIRFARSFTKKLILEMKGTTHDCRVPQGSFTILFSDWNSQMNCLALHSPDKNYYGYRVGILPDVIWDEVKEDYRDEEYVNTMICGGGGGIGIPYKDRESFIEIEHSKMVVNKSLADTLLWCGWKESCVKEYITDTQTDWMKKLAIKFEGN